ncbi:exonuclease [Vibrio phage CP-T1]|uniref:exonuclease n=1 Tax=Vibrio phage CP-T1 TaxID=10689 RepID=UPI0002536C92|nr:exonuclease [Vibrio phage CP-T1]AFC22384.1 putative exonuclease [Vibrio phage CP-T1]AIA08693.1 putative exonuclease [Vibrio phage 24]
MIDHVMIDLETMGNKSNAPIIAIGAVYFDPKTGQTGKEFYSEVSLESSVDLGAKPDPSTILWWLGQSDAARAKFTNNKNAPHIILVLQQFAEFMNTRNVKPWGNGAGFDLGILGNAYDLANMVRPWEFWNERDVRTIVDLDTRNHKKMPFDGIPHYALDDAKHQVKYVSAIIKDLMK